MSEMYKNHPTVMIQNLFSFILIYGLISFSMYGQIGGEEEAPLLMIQLLIAAIFVLLFVGTIFSWKLTSMTLTEQEVLVKKEFIFKKTTVIPYEKIASVNVDRTFWNRVFGTTTLKININSSTNANVPEAVFVFKTELAEDLRTELMAHMFGTETKHTKEEESQEVPYLSFGPWDSVKYGLIGGSTFQSIMGLIFGTYSVISILFLEGDGLLSGLFMLFLTSGITAISTILRLYNLRVYRNGDTIRLQHGAIQNYRTSFNINRINAVRIRRPLIARLFHLSCIDAEVIGLAGEGDSSDPKLTLLIKDSEVSKVISDLIPEFIEEIEEKKQPTKSFIPMMLRTSTYCLLFAIIMAYPCYYGYTYVPEMMYGMNPMDELLIKYQAIAITVLTILLGYAFSIMSYKINRFGLGEDKFVIVGGIVDRKKVVMQYDRVQISEVYASPVFRRAGLAKCKISMMSSMGAKTQYTGYYSREDLERISEIMMERLSDGRYDYRKTTL